MRKKKKMQLYQEIISIIALDNTRKGLLLLSFRRNTFQESLSNYLLSRLITVQVCLIFKPSMK